MKGLVVTKDHQLKLQELEMPRPGPFESLVKIIACGICSTTDTELIRGSQPNHSHYPCLLGHEAIGEVIEIGNKVTSFKTGDWVTRPNGILPGQTVDGISSAWGGFAEYGLVIDRVAMIAAGDFSKEEDYTALRQNVLDNGKAIGIKGAVLSIALAETYDWIKALPLAGKNVCVNGTGIAGLSLACWARLNGAKKVIVLGRRPERLQLAETLGAHQTINTKNIPTEEIVEKLQKEDILFFLEATGVSSQMEIAVRSLQSGGTVGVYGVAPDDQYKLDWRWFPSTISFTKHEPQEQLARKEVVDLILQGKIPVDQLMTDTWPLEQYEQAFAAVENKQVVKAMLLMNAVS